MSASPALIAAWARSAVAPVGGAFRALHAHDLAAPLVHALLQRAGLNAACVDAVIVGNALGAGGNPARMVALAAGLPNRCAALSVDTQCCAGLDAISMAVGMLASGQAQVVIAGGAEAWSRAPMRLTRPLHATDLPVPYERPAFAPDPARDPDLLDAAAAFARQHGVTRAQQDHYALQSHQRALRFRQTLPSDGAVDPEIVPIAGLAHDAYVRDISPRLAARMPLAAADTGHLCAMSTLAVSTKADGAALILLATPEACRKFGLQPQAAWRASSSTGTDPCTPMRAAGVAALGALQRSGISAASACNVVELHDAFAVQGLDFCQLLGLDPERINRHGGGIARGHPIGASGAIALVRVLADLQREEASGATGIAAIAGAGGVGAAVVVQRI